MKRLHHFLWSYVVRGGRYYNRSYHIAPLERGREMCIRDSPCTGSCVITDVKTGQLKALVSYPGYDNNKLANTVDADYYLSLIHI